MNPASPLQLGDHVEIIGPGKMGNTSQIGQNFIIEKIKDGYYSDDHMAFWYPASSLRKVEELQIGDWVQVIDRPSETFRIESTEYSKWSGNTYYSRSDGLLYLASSLRKLAPDEIPHGQTIGEAMQEFSDEVEKAKDAIRDILAPLVDERLSAIEERQESIDSYISRIANVGAAIEERLAFVEAFQRSQIENALDPKTLPRTDLTLGAMIADGTLEVSDFRKKDLKTQRKIIRELEEDLANGCNGMTCAECMDEIESDGIRMAAMEEMKK